MITKLVPGRNSQPGLVESLEQIRNQEAPSVVEDLMISPIEADVILRAVGVLRPTHRREFLRRSVREIYRDTMAAMSSLERAEQGLEMALARAAQAA